MNEVYTNLLFMRCVEAEVHFEEWKTFAIGDYMEWCGENCEEGLYLIVCNSLKNLQSGMGQDILDMRHLAGCAYWNRIRITKLKEVPMFDFEYIYDMDILSELNTGWNSDDHKRLSERQTTE